MSFGPGNFFKFTVDLFTKGPAAFDFADELIRTVDTSDPAKDLIDGVGAIKELGHIVSPVTKLFDKGLTDIWELFKTVLADTFIFILVVVGLLLALYLIG